MNILSFNGNENPKGRDGDAVVKLSYQELFKLNNILYHAQKGGEIKDVVDFNIRRNFTWRLIWFNMVVWILFR